MKHSIEYPLITFILPLLLTFTPVYTQFNLYYSHCWDDIGNYTNPSAYKTNLDVVLLDLTNRASLSLFDNQTIGESGVDRAYGLYMCRGDLNVQQCHDCVSVASKEVIDTCPVQKQAIVWYEQCMVRYSNASIFSREDESYMTWLQSADNASNPIEYSQIVSSTLEVVINQSAYNISNNGYAITQIEVSSLVNLYMMGQCTPDILGTPCERCLRAGFRNMGACCGTARVSLLMYLPSCWLRYAQTPFVGEGITPSVPSPLSMPQPPTPPLYFGPPSPTPVQLIPFSNNSDANWPITSPKTICFKVRFGIPPLSNNTVNSSSTSPSWAITNSSSCSPTWKFELKELLNQDDVDSNERSKEWVTA